MNPANFIHIENLVLNFDEPSGPEKGNVLENINLAVNKGEFLSIVGPSGCGKSTLLKTISGLSSWNRNIKHISGKITIAGEEILNASSGNSAEKAQGIPSNIGFVFQSPTLLEWRCALENIELPGEVLGDASIQEKSSFFLDLVGLAPKADAFPRTLSGGERARVALARALVTEPKVLLMDEPFSSLDEITRETMHEEILGIWEQLRTTFIFVTHSIQEAVFLSNRVAVMSALPGRIEGIVPIDLPYPRTRRMKEQPGFTRLSRMVREMLERVSQKASNHE